MTHPCVCLLCGRVFANKYLLKRHHIVVHQRIYKHHCPHCGKGCRDAADIRSHINAKHRDLGKYTSGATNMKWTFNTSVFRTVFCITYGWILRNWNCDWHMLHVLRLILRMVGQTLYQSNWWTSFVHKDVGYNDVRLECYIAVSKYTVGAADVQHCTTYVWTLSQLSVLLHQL